MNSAKALQDSDFPTKVIKRNINIFTDVSNSAFNSCLKNDIIPSTLKKLMVFQYLKRAKGPIRTAINLLVSRGYLKDACINKSLRILRIIFLVNINVDLENVTVNSIVFW